MHLLALRSSRRVSASRAPSFLTAVPDEETSGRQGMRWLVANHIAELDPERVWDEGSGHPGISAIGRYVPEARVFPLLVPGATDGRYFRERGYAAYGFGPVVLDRSGLDRVHGIDERISIDNLVLGIRMARDVISELCA